MTLAKRLRAFLESLPESGQKPGSKPKPGTKLTVQGDGGKYLTRYTLAYLGPVGLHVHCFHRSDEDKELHSHPWAWAVCLILSGGYREERLTSEGVRSRDMTPGKINLLLRGGFHRTVMLDGESWSLIVTGPKATSWCFLDPGGLTPWREFVSKKGVR